MTKDKFEADYIANSGITEKEYRDYLVTLPCGCDYKFCAGWAAVGNNPLSIKVHEDISGVHK